MQNISRQALEIMRQLGLFNHEAERWELFTDLPSVASIQIGKKVDWIDLSVEIHKLFEANGIGYNTIHPAQDGSFHVMGIYAKDGALVLN